MLGALFAASASAQPGAPVDVCFNYGCADEVTVLLAQDRLESVGALLDSAGGPVEEREAIRVAVGMLYRNAGLQSPIHSDRAGNFLDGGVEGRMDCIDHSTTTTRLLRLMEARGWLRFHRVEEPARRSRVIFQHFSAVVEEIEAPVPIVVEPAAAEDPDHVALLLALCDCEDVLGDLPRPTVIEWSPPFAPGERFVVDSWFVEHGEPAVILPLREWLNGGGPNVQ